MAKLSRETLTLEHVDPRKHSLVCGLDVAENEIICDHSYNSRKTNRFVPYRVCETPAPINFGDIGEFLINGEWVVCEFGGAEWWKESNAIGNSATAWVSKETARKGGKVAGRKNVESGHWATLQTTEIKAMAGKASSQTPSHTVRSRKGGASTSKQQWKCEETGFITNAGALTRYQNARNIDTSLRVRVS